MPLNKEEKETIWKVFKTLRSTSNQISDCQDLWLSDVRDIETAFWSLYHKFDFIKERTEKETK
ncbi:hypothetical protein [uncultured Mediterranean phage uvMED]|nr:hypothetical protein [uncultured Mediterranean phage uvMED]BAR19746.1 hypothetical protein [uncultured Mediterranean phage uvMED]BAR19819.1 hypothetical protein [uncultured Mediterranean phage uvMED]